MTVLAVAGAHAAVLAWLAGQDATQPARRVDAPLSAWVVAAAPSAPPATSARNPRSPAAARAFPPAPADGPTAAPPQVPNMPPAPQQEPVASIALPDTAGQAAAEPDPAPADGTALAAAGAAVADTGPAAPAWSWPRSAELHYDVHAQGRGLDTRASATLRWRADAGRYDLSLQLRLLWLQRSQHSEGELRSGGLRPTRFADRARRERTLTIAWDADGSGRAQRDDGQPLPPLPPGTQDRLSLFVQLGALLAREGAAVGQRWTLPVAGLGGVQAWTLEVEGSETLALPSGPAPAVRVQRVGATAGPQVTLWYEPSWLPLPVRVLLRETDGQLVDQTLRDGKIDAHP